LADIVQTIRYASEFTNVFLQTNGILLNKFLGTPEELALLNLVSISVVADNSNLHRLIMNSNSFERVVRNIQKAISIKEKYCLPVTINAKILVNKHNYTRLPDIVMFVYQNLGVDSISVRLVQDFNFGGNESQTISVKLLPSERQRLVEIIQRSQKTHPSLEMLINSLAVEGAKPPITNHCFNAIDGHFACIDAWGDVYIGLPEIGDQKFCIGNIIKQEWSEIWKSEAHYKVIKLMNSLQQNGICRNELCRHVKANLGAEDYIKGEINIQNADEIMESFGSFL